MDDELLEAYGKKKLKNTPTGCTFCLAIAIIEDLMILKEKLKKGLGINPTG